MCFWPENLPPPSGLLAHCRLVLQMTCAGLFIVSLFAILAGRLFFIVYLLLMAYMLFVSWATFSHGLVLYFFLLCCIQSLFNYVEVIGL